MEPPDVIDALITAWEETRPDLDPAPLAVIGRVLVLAAHLERSVESTLRPHKLSLGQFDILATLRRHEPAGGLTPTVLLRSVLLTSGGMTSRLDRLAAAGLVVRKPDPSDRRGVVVTLTAKGRKLIDAATAARFAEAKTSLPKLSKADLRRLSELLRTWLREIGEDAII